MTLVLVPRRLLEDAQKAINTLADEVCGKRAAQWAVVNEALVGLGTALRANMKPEVPGDRVAESEAEVRREFPDMDDDWVMQQAADRRMVQNSFCRFPNANPVYPDRTCPKCHEDMNMQGGCRCNGYTMAGGPPKAPIR